MSPTDYQSVYDSLLQAIPSNINSDHRSSREGKIKFGYEFSLQKRVKLILKSVLKDYKDDVEAILKDFPNFVEALVHARNYYTHYPEDKVEPSPNELYSLIQKMKLIMQMCFLRELEIPVQAAKSIIAKSRGFQTWLS